MTKNKGIFNKITVVDIIAILIVVVAVAGICYRLLGDGSKALRQTQTFNYSMRIKGVRKPTVDVLEQSVDTEFELNEKQKSDMGVLKNFTYQDAESIIVKTDGTLVKANIPNKYDIVLDFEITGRVTEKAYMTPQLKELAVGSFAVIKNKLCSVEGEFIKVGIEL